MTDPKPCWVVTDTQWEEGMKQVHGTLRKRWLDSPRVLQAMVMAMYKTERDARGRIPDAHYQSFLTHAAHFVNEYLVEEAEEARWWRMMHRCKRMHITPCIEYCSMATCRKGDYCPNVTRRRRGGPLG